MAAPRARVRGCVKIVDNGPNGDRYNIVILGDGYRASDLTKYRADVKAFIAGIKAMPPFTAVWPGINVHRVDVSSVDQGAADPLPCGGTGATPNTFFNAKFCNFGIRRLLLVDETKALGVAYAQVPEAHFVLCLVNSLVFGGAGGRVATASRAPGTIRTAVHEMGHSAFGLADEYEYYAGCGSGEAGHDQHDPVEPAEPNVTLQVAAGAIKWAAQLTNAADRLPTTRNADCTQCDPQPNPRPAGFVGAYEGAHYVHCGAFRPAFDCKMRTLTADFCAVCQQVIRDTLEPFLPAGQSGPPGPQVVVPVNPPPLR